MKNIAVLTSLQMPDLLPYDHEILGNLNAEPRVKAKPIVWETQSEQLSDFDIALFRTTWGYHEKIEKFKKFLDFLDEIKLPALNPTSIIRDNLHKFYLKDLASKGVNILPTEFIKRDSQIELKSLVEINSWNKFVIKPAVSAGSYKTFLFDSEEIKEAEMIYSELKMNRDVLVQKYFDSVKTLGEFSTIYFANGYKYSVNKIPEKGDFRVQYQYGGQYRMIELPKSAAEQSDFVASIFINNCLYTRIDGLMHEDKFYIMEVELIEPDLYLNIHPEGIGQFVESVTGFLH